VWVCERLYVYGSNATDSILTHTHSYVPSFEELMGNLEDEAQEIQDGDVSIDDDGLYRRDPMFAFKVRVRV
jgi:hypothetical protein